MGREPVPSDACDSFSVSDSEQLLLASCSAFAMAGAVKELEEGTVRVVPAKLTSGDVRIECFSGKTSRVFAACSTRENLDLLQGGRGRKREHDRARDGIGDTSEG